MKVRNYLKSQKGKSEYFSANDYRYLVDTLLENVIPLQDDLKDNDDVNVYDYWPSISAMNNLYNAFKDILRNNPEFESAITNLADLMRHLKERYRGETWSRIIDR